MGQEALTTTAAVRLSLSARGEDNDREEERVDRFEKDISSVSTTAFKTQRICVKGMDYRCED